MNQTGLKAITFALLTLSWMATPSAHSADAAAIGIECSKTGGGAEQIQACIKAHLSGKKQPTAVGGQVLINPPKGYSVNDKKPQADGDGSQPALVKGGDEPSMQGCRFLVYSKYNMYHAPGTRICQANTTYECDNFKKDYQGKMTYNWRVLDPDDCVGAQQAKQIEFNKTVHLRADEAMKKSND